jgi:hypothetical protein
MSVFGAEVDLAQVSLLTEKCGTLASSSQSNFKVLTIVDDDVKRVSELHDFVSIANYLNLSFFIRFQLTISLYDFPNSVLQLRESRVLSYDLRFVVNLECLWYIFQNSDVSPIEFL